MLKWIEFLLLFVFIPSLLFFDVHTYIKLSVVLTGLLYVIIVTIRSDQLRFKTVLRYQKNFYWRNILEKLGVIVLLSTIYVVLFHPADLFKVLINKPLLWVIILFVYSILSVFPQEFLYRTFFFYRYENLFKNRRVFILINAAVFSLCHLFLQNLLVMIITFIGGILFALTYEKTKSLLIVSIEHSLYGIWLFTVGMGDALAFPS